MAATKKTKTDNLDRFKNLLIRLAKNDSFQKTLASTFLIFVTISALIVSYGYLKEKPKDEKVNINPEIDVSQITQQANNKRVEIEKLKSLKSVSVYENGLITPPSLISYCKKDDGNQTKCNSEIANITRKLRTSGSITTAKLYMKVGVSRDSSPITPLTQYDSVWFLLDSTDISGHLVRSKSLYEGITEDGYSELIFDLFNLPITKEFPYSEANKVEPKNALGALNSKSEHIIASFVSTFGLGKIQELKIYFEGGDIFLIEN